MDNLREAGKWIQAHEEAIFNTTYWFVQSEVVGGPEIRFTQNNGAFYITFLEEPLSDSEGYVAIEAPIPILEGDSIGGLLDWTVNESEGSYILKIKVSSQLLASEKYGWVFKIQYC